MKKIILSTLVLFALASCKKESQKNDDTVSADSIATNETTEVKKNEHLLSESTQENVSQYLSLAKDNDTLYITNFFATWCGPCIKEIPHFKKKMEELKGKPVKFTFVSLDNKADWNTKVSQFVDEQDIRENTLLLDGETLNKYFFQSNFKEWTGGSIPFTYMKRGSKIDEILGMVSKEELDAKINSFLK